MELCYCLSNLLSCVIIIVVDLGEFFLTKKLSMKKIMILMLLLPLIAHAQFNKVICSSADLWADRHRALLVVTAPFQIRSTWVRKWVILSMKSGRLAPA